MPKAWAITADFSRFYKGLASARIDSRRNYCIDVLIDVNETISFQNNKSEKNWNFAPETKKAALEACFLDLAKIMTSYFAAWLLWFQPHHHHQPQPWCRHRPPW